jgi:hypothetical protein
MKKNRGPVLLLLLLAPVCGEIVSTSAPPVEFFQPFSLITLIALYGCGALLVREFVRRWNQGWLSIFLLGMAYGIYEEGIVVRSFFDTAWPDLGLLATYGRWLGVNWVWAEWLTIFHAVISITVPIALVELVFPSSSDQLWLRRRGLVITTIPFLAVAAIGPLFGMRASFLAVFSSLVSMFGLGLMAYFVPRHGSRSTPQPGSEDEPVRPAKPGTIMFRAFFLMLGVLLTFMLLPELNVPVLITMGSGAGLVLIGIRAVHRSGGSAWTGVHRWAAVTGALLPWLMVDVIAELDNLNRPDDTSGMALFALLSLILLLVLGWRISRQGKGAVEASIPVLDVDRTAAGQG